MALHTINLSGIGLPLAIRPGMRMTDDELIRFSERNRPFRFERNKEGEIVMMTPVGGIGGTHETYVAAMLFAWCEQTGIGIVFGPNTGFNLPDGSCLSPDAAWLSLERWNALTPKQQAGFPPLCPEFVIEIRSRSDPRRMVEAKMQLWLENGAELAWLIDPIDGNIVVYEQNSVPVVLDRPHSVLGAGPVAGFELRTSRLWNSQ